VPCFFVHGKPIVRNFFGEVAIAKRSAPQPLVEGCRTVHRGIVANGTVNEPAVLAGLCRTLDRLYGLVLQDHIDSFCHG
jgi:hypothetical protein